MKKYLIAVSGGPDSMTLLSLIKHKQIEAVIHINYNYRKDSWYDHKLVKKYCNKHHLKLYTKTINPKIYIKNKIGNFEAWARKVRYNYFLLISKITHTKRILIAHHKDDFVETALMQLKQKKHLYFYGIKKINYYHSLKVIRPFLNRFWKEGLLQYCLKNKIKYAIDQTNFSNKYLRNQLRNKMLSKNKQKNQLFCLINKLNEIIKDRMIVFNEIFNQWKRSSYDLDFLNKQTQYIKQYLVTYYLYKNKIKNLSWNKTTAIVDYLRNKNNCKKFRLLKNLFLAKNKKSLIMIRLND